MKNERTNVGPILIHPKSRLVVAACLILAASALPVTELARAGGSPPQPVDSTPFLLPASINGCGFDYWVSLSGKSGRINLPGGNFILTSPGLHVTLTNANDSTKTVTLNVTGSSRYSTDQNGNFIVKATGRNAFFGPAFGTLLFIGDFTVVLDPNTGVLLQAPTGNGQIINVCEMIN